MVGRGRLFLDRDVGEAAGGNQLGPKIRDLLAVPERAAQGNFAVAVHRNRVKPRAGRRGLGKNIQRVEVGRLVQFQVLEKVQLAVNDGQARGVGLERGNFFREMRLEQQRLGKGQQQQGDGEQNGAHRPFFHVRRC